MSWYLNLTGKRDAVKEMIFINPSLPEEVRRFVLAHLGEEQTACNFNGVRIEGAGHLNYNDISAQSYVTQLKITPVNIIESDMDQSNDTSSVKQANSANATGLPPGH